MSTVFTVVIPLVVLTFLILLVYFAVPVNRPFPTESDLSNPGVVWKLYYAKKYVRPILRAQRKSNEERYFRDMNFSFDTESPEEESIIRIRAVGDLMARRDMGEERGASLWDEVGAYLFTADLSIGNLECAVNPDRIIHKTIQYSVHPKNADRLLGDKRFGQFSAVSLGNNHINDSGPSGIVSTCRYLDAKGIARTGAAATPEEVDSITCVQVRNLKIGILSYTFSLNGTSLSPEFHNQVNVVRFNALDERKYDPTRVYRQIAEAREQGVDYIIACVHWGVEFELYPQTRFIKRGHDLLDAGIDCIIGHHPHIINPVERYRTHDNRDGLIFYSLGSLTTYALKHPITTLSTIASVDLQTGWNPRTGKQTVRPRDVSIVPCVFSQRSGNTGKNYRIIPLYTDTKARTRGFDTGRLSGYDMRLRAKIKRIFEHSMRQPNLTCTAPPEALP